MDKSEQLGTLIVHVERMLDVLLAHGQTAVEFASRCQALEAYLAANPIGPDLAEGMDEDRRNRLGRVVDKLNKLTLRARDRADIPAGLQKFIAEQQD